MPPLLAERFRHLDASYPEWQLPDGEYCVLMGEGDRLFWSYIMQGDTLYSPPILWKGEISSSLATALRTLGNHIQTTHNPPGRRIASVTFAIALVTLLVLHGKQGFARYNFTQELKP
jgi:hypothetical protein